MHFLIVCMLDIEMNHSQERFSCLTLVQMTHTSTVSRRTEERNMTFLKANRQYLSPLTFIYLGYETINLKSHFCKVCF